MTHDASVAAQTENPSSRIAVGIATIGRPTVLAETLLELRRQTRPPDRILICHTEPQDVAGTAILPNVELLTGPRGLPQQRNTILDAASDCDILLFLDDDFLAAPGYVEATVAAMRANQNIVATTGTVIADGATGPGLGSDIARQLLDRDSYDGPWPGLSTIRGAYGCNMAVRLAAARLHAIRFDERLPLYAWWEDIDFTHRLGRHGRVVKVSAARGVHLGVKAGRTSGLRLGYSQVANPLYMATKGSISWRLAAQGIGRHIVINLVRSVRPESYVDRRGRLRGNFLALGDRVTGRMRPERILDL